MIINLDSLIAEPGKKHKVKNFSTNFTAGLGKEEAEDFLKQNVLRMVKQEGKFYADNRHAMLIVFQAMDAAGKDGTIKHVMSGLNPQSCIVYSFKQPSKEELDHDYMWRIMKSMPERGRIGVFNRSHYEELLIAKVHPDIILNQHLPGINSCDDIDKSFWEKRYRQINDIERYLSENGVIILKFFLNVSKEEQKKRFMARLDDESKNWKFSLADIKERGYWDDYMKAYSSILSKTSTECAPWYVIPADNKWFMRFAVGEIICKKMESLKLQYPRLSSIDLDKLIEAKKVLESEKE